MKVCHDVVCTAGLIVFTIEDWTSIPPLLFDVLHLQWFCLT